MGSLMIVLDPMLFLVLDLMMGRLLGRLFGRLLDQWLGYFRFLSGAHCKLTV